MAGLRHTKVATVPDNPSYEVGTSEWNDNHATDETDTTMVLAPDGLGGVEFRAETGGGGGGAPTTADYLVGTSNAGLSAEIVVGTSPGGELGGSWASPTVDATHSGTSHAGTLSTAEGYTDTAVAALSTVYQPVDSDLTAIAALTTTSYGRAFLALADAAAARTALSLGTAAQSASTDFQPVDSDLTAIAALTTTSFGRGLLASADAAALRTSAGLGTLATQSGTFSGTSSGTNTGDQTNITGNAATVTTNANLTGDVTSSGNATTIGAGKVTEAMQVTADNTTANVSTSKHGYAPKAPNDATKYLDGTGAYSVPAGGTSLASAAYKRTAGDYSTNSTSFVSVDGTNMSLTITTGAHRVLCGFTGSVSNDATNSSVDFDVTIDGTLQGATTHGLQRIQIYVATAVVAGSFTFLTEALSAGSHTFILKWKVSGNNGTVVGTDPSAKFWVMEQGG